MTRRLLAALAIAALAFVGSASADNFSGGIPVLTPANLPSTPPSYKTGNYTVTATDIGIPLCLQSSGVSANATFTIPAAGSAGFGAGTTYYVCDQNATYSLTLSSTSSFIGLPTNPLTKGMWAVLISDGSSWLAMETTPTGGSGGGAGYSIVSIPGSWYWPYPGLTYAGVNNLHNGVITCAPGVLLASGGQTVEGLGDYIQTVGTTNVQFAIYSVATSGSEQGYPNQLLGHTGDIPDTATGAVSAALTANTSSLPAGEYYFCSQQNDNTAVISGISTTGSTSTAFFGQPSNSDTFTGPTFGVYATEATYGTWPASFTGGASTWTATAGAPAIQPQILSSP